MRTIHKEVGETPLQAIQRVTKEKATYAGRLDPMATGKLLVLVGEETKQREKYLGLDKEYVMEVLLDAETDTGDILGLATLPLQQTRLSNNIVQKALGKERGTHVREYPHFSSKPVQGKPLFTYALAGTLDTIEIPQHEETIYYAELLDTRFISSEYLLQYVEEKLSHVRRSTLPSKELGADFRQDAVRESWNTALLNSHRNFQVLKIRVACGSGTYMRTLAMRLGGMFGTKALALSIHRTKIGKIQKIFNFFFWKKEY